MSKREGGREGAREGGNKREGGDGGKAERGTKDCVNYFCALGTRRPARRGLEHLLHGLLFTRATVRDLSTYSTASCYARTHKSNNKKGEKF